MNEFITCLISTNGLAYLTGLVIFLITLLLVYKKVIGFPLTLILLLFALGAALAVANQKAINNYIHGLSKEKTTDNTYQAQSTQKEEKEENTLTDKLQKAYEDLKEEFEIYKKKVEDYMREQPEKNKENPPPNPPPK